ncbi:DnaJ-like subfamily C member 28 [Holothuria leucospilota]|uniref:DnaJ-like subfamily C member 28 n=1 Tax=Holothuria leucospilota TaxID=206669 RepID=A0A9Q1C8G4_HOLLE|nr:DnaJ-like subfamily C member 28 [Holothuria leucospilota]
MWVTAECILFVGYNLKKHIHIGSPFFKQSVFTLSKSLDILDLSNDCSFNSLREKYAELAKIYYQDDGDEVSKAKKVSELQEAYKVVHTHLESKLGTDVDGELDFEETGNDHFVNYDTFSAGSPSQKEGGYVMQKILKAQSTVADHTVKNLTESDGDGNFVTHKQERSVKATTATASSSIEKMVDNFIQQYINQGDFENLPGKGKPLPPGADYWPFVDTTQYKLNQVMINNGAFPEFIALEKEIKARLANAKEQLFRARVKLGPEPLNSFNQKKWDDMLRSFEKSVKKINKIVEKFNMVVPVLRLQKAQIQAKKEVKEVLNKYDEYEQKKVT